MHRTERVRAQRHGAEHLTGPHVDLDPATRSRRQLELDAGAPGPGHGHVDLTRARRSGRRSQHGLGRQDLGPTGPTQVGRHGRAGDVDLLDAHTGAARLHRRRQRRQVGGAGRAADPDETGSVGPQREAQGRALGAAAHHVLAPPQDAHDLTAAVGQLLGAGGNRAASLPPERAAVGQRGRGGVVGPAPTGVGLDVGGLHPGRLQREGPLAPGHIDGVRQRDRAVAALDAPAAGPGGADPRGQRRVRAELEEGTGRRRVVGEAAAAEDHVGARALEGRPLHLGAPGRQHRDCAGRPPARPWPRRCRARCTRPRRWTATPCTGTGGRAGPPRRRGATVAFLPRSPRARPGAARCQGCRTRTGSPRAARRRTPSGRAGPPALPRAS